MQVLWFLIVISFMAYFVFLLAKPSVWLAKGQKWGTKSTNFHLLYRVMKKRTPAKIYATSGSYLDNVVAQVVHLLNTSC